MFDEWNKPNEIIKLIRTAGLNPELMTKIEHKAAVESWFYAMLKKSVAAFHPDVTNYDSHADFVKMNEAKEKLLQLPFYMILRAVSFVSEPTSRKRKEKKKTTEGRSKLDKQLLSKFALGKHQGDVRNLNSNKVFPLSNLDLSVCTNPIFTIANFRLFFESRLNEVENSAEYNELKQLLKDIIKGQFNDLESERVFNKLAFLYKKYSSKTSTWINGNQPIYRDATRGVLAIDENCRYKIESLSSLVNLPKMKSDWNRHILVGSIRWPSLIHRLKKLEHQELQALINAEPSSSIDSYRSLGLVYAADLELYEILEPELVVGNYLVVYCSETNMILFPAKIAGEARSTKLLLEID